MCLKYEEFANQVNFKLKDWDDEFVNINVKDQQDINIIDRMLSWGSELGYFTEYDKDNGYIRIFKRKEFLKYLDQPKKKYLIHYFNPEIESLQTQLLTFADEEISDYCAILASKGYLEICYTHYDQEKGAPTNSYMYYPQLERSSTNLQGSVK